MTSRLSTALTFLALAAIVWACLTMLAGCATHNKGVVVQPVQPAPESSTAGNSERNTNAQEGLVNAIAELRNEINGLKAGRDIKGVEINSEFNAVLGLTAVAFAILTALKEIFFEWLDYRLDLARIRAGKI